MVVMMQESFCSKAFLDIARLLFISSSFSWCDIHRRVR
jgi:hypothetical protein